MLGGKIGDPFDYGPSGPGGWWLTPEPELHLDDEIVVPDLAGWRRERMPVYPDTAYVTLAPDWVCEVHSPSTRKVDLHEKRPLYAQAGVRHLWFVDPTDRTLEAFELRDGEWVLIATAKDNESVSIRPFDAITFSLGDLWAGGASAQRPADRFVRANRETGHCRAWIMPVFGRTPTRPAGFRGERAGEAEFT